MKNITLSADAELIAAARRYAEKQQTSLNDLYRDWLQHYVSTRRAKESTQLLKDFRQSQAKLSFRSDRKYTRAEMNER